MKRDPLDPRRRERTAGSFLASAIVHALIAIFVFSVATSSSQQSPESVPGGIIMTVSSRPVPTTAPASVPKVSAPVPHATVVPKVRAAAQPRSAPPHPRVLHELAKFAPTAPPNPTPAPVSSLAPNPVPTQAVIAASPAPLPTVVPTSVPTAAPVTVAIKAPPTATPVPKPSAAPTQAPRTPAPLPTAVPKAASPTPMPEPTIIAASPAPIAQASPVAVTTPGISQVKIKAPQQQHGTAPTPGPKAVASPGPRGVAPVKTVAIPRPVQVPPPKPHPAAAGAGKHHPTLNERLHNLIPTGAPATPSPQASAESGWRVGNIMPTPEPEPTPPPEVVAATKFLFVENEGAQRWKQSWLGTAPEERYVKMYVTSVKHIGFIQWCTGWVLRAPIAGNRKWIVEPNESFVCSGHLEPFTVPSPLPSGAP